MTIRQTWSVLPGESSDAAELRERRDRSVRSAAGQPPFRGLVDRLAPRRRDRENAALSFNQDVARIRCGCRDECNPAGLLQCYLMALGAVAPQTKLVTDDWPSYQDLPGIKHKAITVGPMAAHIVLPWTHRLFSNLKRWGLGVYHGLRRTNLQHYLDEFMFRFNRRRTRHAAFDTLLEIGARTAPASYRVLIRKTA